MTFEIFVFKLLLSAFGVVPGQNQAKILCSPRTEADRLYLRKHECGRGNRPLLQMQRHYFLSTTILAAAISFLFGAEECYAQAHTRGTPVVPFTPALKPGDYAWHPEVSPAGRWSF